MSPADGRVNSEISPAVDHHQHLFGPATAALILAPPIDAADLIAHLDAAGIQRAVVLSAAYSWRKPGRAGEGRIRELGNELAFGGAPNPAQ
jgi:hypothetical protein